MSYTVGTLVGAFIAIWLLSRLFEWAILKRVLDDPIKGKVGAVLLALVFIEGVYWCTSYSPFNTQYGVGAFCYFVAALFWAILGYVKGARLRDENWDYGPDQGLDETFR